MSRVLIVDDQVSFLRQAADLVSAQGHVAVTVESGAAALKLLRTDANFTAVLLDLVMPDLDGFAVLETLRREAINLPVVVTLNSASVDLVQSVLGHGASDYLEKPLQPERLMVALANAARLVARDNGLRVSAARAHGVAGFEDIVGLSPALERAKLLAARAAKLNLPILIEGEQGSGKAMLAQAITAMSERAGRPFIALHCAHLMPQHIEAALFGRVGDGSGAFRAAQGGTLYIDEIGDMPLPVQEKLLDTIANGEITPIGASRPERINVRVIAASSRRLMHVVREGHFREDLYYRLHVQPLYMPPLRDRREDIAVLADEAIARICAQTGKPVMGVAPETLALLEAYDWPGNLDQFEAALVRAVAMTEQSLLEPHDFPQVLARVRGPHALRSAVAGLDLPAQPEHVDVAPPRRRPEAATGPDRFVDAEGVILPLEAIERDLIVFAIEHCHGRMSRVARALGIGRSTLYRKLHEYGLDDHIERDAA